ncbi:LolA family protein [Cecembia lonarensis]|uniref:Outer membrane lipoprotein-sorting protein n=1 Tax=Cecembia lonarensis (strain CCUG 58316 / KCTC 22772 / LW9) TaxID=1225176 RepID=K1L5F4_CECL9|nr:outer membrane lipoprotein carrier protein LolA [Cecembia lonarensis]EKB50021.1 Outer membrane lipoprotein-sorting protein [Cecembia lonarensis LW9]
MFQKLVRFVLLLVLISNTAFSQKDPKAKAILDGVSQKYQSLKGMKASFEFSDGRMQPRKGEVAIKGEKYRIKLPEQEIFNNGKTVWTFIESGNYKEVTINNASDMGDELTPSSVYNIYKKGYNYRLIGERTENKKILQDIELLAESASAPFKRVILTVDKEQKDLLGWEIYDDQGDMFKYTFTNINTNVDIPNDYFNFDPQQYGKVEIIDLR